MGIESVSKIEKLNTMFGLQSKLNNETVGQNWASGVTKDGKAINWKRCIYIGVAGLIGGFPVWKHWDDTNTATDIDDAKNRLVSIWHVLLSEMIQRSLDRVAENVYKSIISAAYAENKKTDDIFMIIRSAEKIINEATKTNSSTNSMLLSFFVTCALVGLSFDELSTKYIEKNTVSLLSAA